MKLLKNFFFSCILLLIASSSHADTTNVRFGSPGGDTYRPSNFYCHVGDTVIFVGDFDLHPLLFDEVPLGAIRHEIIGGKTPFKYVVRELGKYTYQCENHGTPGSGMHGEFTAGELGVGDDRTPKTIVLSQNYPNPVKNLTKIEYHLEKAGFVSLKVFSSDGNEITTLIDAKESEGHHVVPFNTQHLAPGAYFYRLSIDGETLTSQLVVTK